MFYRCCFEKVIVSTVTGQSLHHFNPSQHNIKDVRWLLSELCVQMFRCKHTCKHYDIHVKLLQRLQKTQFSINTLITV